MRVGRVRRGLETGCRQAQAHRAAPLTPEQGLIKKAATGITVAPIPSSFPSSSRADFSTHSPDAEKASPSGHGAAHRALGQPGLPRFRCCAPPAIPSQPRVRSPDPPNTPSSQPSSSCHWSSSTSRPAPYPAAEPPTPHPFPAPAPGTAPAPLPDPCRARLVLPDGDCRSPSAIFLPPGAGPDACSPLSPFTPAPLPFPRLHQALRAF